MCDKKAYPNLASLLIHQGAMKLLDQIETFDTQSITTSTNIKTNAWFADSAGHMPSWIGIELMAQTAACCQGYLQFLAQQKPKIGYLIGLRNYKPTVAAFSPNQGKLYIKATINHLDHSGLSIFDCQINQESTLVTATIKLFLPNQL